MVKRWNIRSFRPTLWLSSALDIDIVLAGVARRKKGGKGGEGQVTKKLYTSVAVTPAPVWGPTQWPLILSFTAVVG